MMMPNLVWVAMLVAWTAETATVTVQQAGTRFILHLNRSGRRGGLIAVEAAGIEVHDAFPETVEALEDRMLALPRRPHP
jgi:hypothetical protein